MTAHAPATDDVLRASLSGAGARRVVRLDPRFQGLPDTAHGGSVLAVFDAIASVPRSRRLVGSYRRRVPLGAPLVLSVEHDDDAVRHFQLSEGATVLVEGSVEAASRDAAKEAPPPAPLRDPGPLPVSKTCFACGRENALGLRVELAIDDQQVGGVWVPHETLRAADGGLAPVAVTTLLDEAAFWLGAARKLVTGLLAINPPDVLRRVFPVYAG
jgi:hypothetical protein